ncbi:DNA-binding transcriptional regulator, LysR family [Sporobacter termitidis DSM 10068]|uniref:DNA-binding transcriptional regulator, LysR family n=1 Tax=Sporobacter termitidis DSM 10068 TaxID=1123282 RepID=A0A1M5UCW6_9FIRM|nr:DNA-binding transcriptional regulator, LysR family [Sporobacter termitidis DSM 10068]
MVYNITFQQLATFFAVADHLNISETANAMYISQSALSKTIHRLEDGLGMKLFLRSNRGLALSKEGEFLYSKLRTPYNNMCKNIQLAKDMKKAKIIRIGYPSTYDASNDYDKLKRLIDDYAARHPEIELSEILYDFMDLKHALLYGDVDIIFSHDFIFNNVPHVSTKRVCRSRTCLAMSKKHPFAVYNSFSELIKEDFEKEYFYALIIDDEISDRERSLSRLKKYGIVPKDMQYVLNFQSLMRAIRQGKGMTVGGYFPNVPGHEEIKFIDMPQKKDDPYLVVAWRTDDLSKEAQDFINIIPDDPEGMTVFGHGKDEML